MRTYYHTYPTCPNCHEPHITGTGILDNADAEYLMCPACGACFRRNIDIMSIAEKIPCTIRRIPENEESGVKDIISKFPLPWSIEPNAVEEAYINWIHHAANGKYLITWPWKSVKFLPLLISEYLLADSTRKAVIIGNIGEEGGYGEEIFPPDVYTAFRSLLYIEDSQNLSPPEDTVKKEMKHFDRKLVLLKKRVVHQTIRSIGTSYWDKRTCYETFRKCINALKKEIKESFGDSAIRTVETRKFNADSFEEKIVNPDGFIDLKLEERDEWPGELYYKKEWLWTALLNLGNLHQTGQNIPFTVAKTPEAIENDKRLLFVPSNLEPNIIFSIIENFNHTLLIIQDADFFMKDKIYGGDASRKFIDFLKNSSDSKILMFSSDPDIRHLYGINQSGPYNFIEECGIIPHTWDSDMIVKKIREKSKTESRYENPVSSKMDELPTSNTLPAIDYITVEKIDGIDDFLKALPETFDITSIRAYIYDLKRTPLEIAGDYIKPELFKREPVTYDKLMSTLSEVLLDEFDEDVAEEKYRALNQIFADIYGPELRDNPILKEIVKKAESLLSDPNIFITIVVHGYDVRGTERLLNGHLSSPEVLKKKISVSSWSSLSRREREIPHDSKHYVISTLPPSFKYGIYYSRVSKFIFVGGSENIDKIQTIIDKRLVDSHSRPVFRLAENDESPELLKSILELVDMPSNDVLRSISDEISVDFDYGRADSSLTHYSYAGGTYPSISVGDHAAFVEDNNGNCMFIPYGRTLFIRKDNVPAELTVVPKNVKGLSNREIIMNRNNLYVSFKSVFIRFMVANGEHVIFHRGPYKWEGFLNLYNDAISWINNLEKTITIIESTTSEEVDAEQVLAHFLSDLDLGANDPSHIKGWWSNYEIVSTEKGEIPIYEIEHPRSRDDIRKMYEAINEKWPEMKLDILSAERSYIAAITVQKFRRSFLKGKKPDMNPALSNLHRKLEKEIEQIIRDARIFKVKASRDVEIIKETDPFRIMQYPECEEHMEH